VEQFYKGNTGFIVVARSVMWARHSTRPSLVFTTRKEPGSLDRAVALFAEQSTNLLKLESRPIPGRP